MLCKVYALHWRVFVKHRLCLSCLLALDGGLYLAVGQTPVKLRLRSTSFGFRVLFWLVIFILATLCLGGSGSLVSSSFFKNCTREVCHHHSGAKTSQSGKMSSNLCYFALTLWFSQGPKIQKILRMLPSFCRFTLSFYMPCECWQTVNSAVTFVEKSSPNLHLFLQLVKRNSCQYQWSVELWTLVRLIGLWKGCSCQDAVFQVVQGH